MAVIILDTSKQMARKFIHSSSQTGFHETIPPTAAAMA
jgi:hypothetical protein